MRHFSLSPAPRKRNFVIAAVVALGVLLLAGLAFHFATSAISVRIDGRAVEVSSGTRVADLFSRGLVTRSAGNLLAVRDHRVLKPRGGETPYVLVNGHRGKSEDRLKPEDVLVTHDGADTLEPLSSRTELIEPSVQYRGSGAVQSVTAGHPGLRKVIFGSLSRETVRTQTLVSPVAEVVERLRPSPGAKLVALTFDDGPWPRQTEAILKILKANSVGATFFEIGEQAKREPKLSSMLANAGMVLGNHTETHPNLARLAPAVIQREIEQAETDITTASGQRPLFFRPPGGSLSTSVYPILARLGLRLVLWDVDPRDWQRPPTSVIVSRVMGAVRPGAIILLHDGGGDRSHTVAALPTVIKQLKAQGYAFVSLDALLSSSKK